MEQVVRSSDIFSELESQSPQQIIRHALESHQEIAISFSGAEDIVLVDMAVKIDPEVKVFSLDTGRLHPQTYQYLDQIREYFRLKLEILTPDSEVLDPFVQQKGLFSFLKDGHQECCSIRKVAPLKRKLHQLEAWITGQRKDQSVGTRQYLPVVEEDPVFSTQDSELIKYNPLANWSSQRVWQYIRDAKIPFNPLHQQGFVSIGCEPCTRPVLPNQHEREGRWWWEEESQKECGLHSGNLKPA